MKNPFSKFKEKFNSDQYVRFDEDANDGKLLKFAKRVGNYFNTEPQKEKVLQVFLI